MKGPPGGADGSRADRETWRAWWAESCRLYPPQLRALDEPLGGVTRPAFGGPAAAGLLPRGRGPVVTEGEAAKARPPK